MMLPEVLALSHQSVPHHIPTASKTPVLWKQGIATPGRVKDESVISLKIPQAKD